MIKYYNINGEILSTEEAVIHVKDLGFLRGYSVFDYFRIYKGRPLFIEDHLDRLEYSSGKLGLPLPYSRAEIIKKVVALAKINQLESGGIKIILTGGYSLNGFLPTTPNFVMVANPPITHPESYYTKGIKLIAYQYTRDTPDIKSTNYLKTISLQKEIEEAEAFDVLYHDGEFISESARSNFFIVNEAGTIITPDKDVLHGITRKHVLEIANKHFNVEIRPISLTEARAAKECFMTGSNKAIMPIRQVDFWRINKGIIGDTTKQMMALFKQYVEDYVREVV